MTVITHTQEEHTTALAQYMPDGALFEAKNINDSNFRKLLKGFAGELFTAEGYLKTFHDQFIPDATILFLSDWERTVGIPDECFSGTGSIADRRRDVLVKLASLGVQTAADFEALGDLFGIDVSVSSGIDSGSFPYTFPMIFFNSPADARFTIVVNFPLPQGGFFIYNFPVIFGDKTQFILKCLFRKLAPANCQVIFRS